ncbi:hypothetical protein GE061_011731 [Apolygus lucorum]|uniref:Uncharacterized protein n=1 Tax=Apolygus lucorum TaxID=248454 RepID=A0A6A4JSF3_APOLU|nr:hypothetical protein GE061_011731 [Apolygus lucorum]
MTKHPKEGYSVKLIDTFYHQIPAFTDVFDEETFYVFVVCFVLSTFLLVFIVSRFITLRPIDWISGEFHVHISLTTRRHSSIFPLHKPELSRRIASRVFTKLHDAAHVSTRANLGSESRRFEKEKAEKPVCRSEVVLAVGLFARSETARATHGENDKSAVTYVTRSRIDLPAYETYNKLYDKLCQAVEETCGFAVE